MKQGLSMSQHEYIKEGIMQSLYNAMFQFHMNGACYTWIMLWKDNYIKELKEMKLLFHFL